MNWIKGFIIIALSSVISLKILDISFGFLYEVPKNVIEVSDRYIPLKEFKIDQKKSITPSDSYLLGTDSLIKQPYEISIDSNGFINNELNKVDNAKYNIIFYGGSTTESIFVSENLRFVSLLENKLRKNLDNSLNVYNGGVSGAHSMHSALKLIGVGLNMKPQVVVFMHNINDMATLVRGGSYWSNINSRSILRDPSRKDIVGNHFQENPLKITLRKIKNFLVPNLYNYITPRIKKILSKNFPEAFEEKFNDEFAESRIEISKENIDHMLELFERSLRLQISICKIWDIEPILMTQFNRINLNDQLFLKFSKQFPETSAIQIMGIYNSFNDLIRKVAKDSNITLIDLDKNLPKESMYMYDIVHLNDDGSTEVFEIIYPKLVDVLVNLEG